MRGFRVLGAASIAGTLGSVDRTEGASSDRIFGSHALEHPERSASVELLDWSINPRHRARVLRFDVVCLSCFCSSARGASDRGPTAMTEVNSR